MTIFQTIETERRFAQTLPRLDFDSISVDRILQLASSTELKGLVLSNGLTYAHNLVVTKANDDTDEKIFARLGITYGVLRRLGYSEDVVEKCLRKLNTFDLEEAFDMVRFRTAISFFSHHLLQLYMNHAELESGQIRDGGITPLTDTLGRKIWTP